VEYINDADEPEHLGDVLDVSQPDDEDGLGTTEMLADLYTAVEKDGGQPMFVKLIEDAKHALCPGSAQSRLSFLVRMLHIKSFYRISNTRFSAILKLMSIHLSLLHLYTAECHGNYVV